MDDANRNQMRAERRRKRDEEELRRAAEARRRRTRTRVALASVAGLALAVVALVAVLAARQAGNEQATSQASGGVQSSTVEPGHAQGTLSYEQTPPAGGTHNPAWQNCGYYSAPVANENAVHSLEHGAVWITYRPDLPQSQITTLRQLAQNQTYVLVSPYPDLPSPVVASAWGKQQRLSSADDPGLESFVGDFRQGPQTPERGAPCTGGIGQPG